MLIVSFLVLVAAAGVVRDVLVGSGAITQEALYGLSLLLLGLALLHYVYQRFPRL